MITFLNIIWLYVYGCIEMTSHGGPYGNLVNYTPSHRKTRLPKRSERKHMNRPTCLGTSPIENHLHERRFSTPNTLRSLSALRTLSSALTHSPFDSIPAAALKINSVHCCDLCRCCPSLSSHSSRTPCPSISSPVISVSAVRAHCYHQSYQVSIYINDMFKGPLIVK